MNENGTVSVIIPAYNAGRYLAEAIGSVLAQHYHSLELIVVDDGSTDNTAEVARSLGTAIRYLQQPNGGIAAALNRGLEAVRGEWLGFFQPCLAPAVVGGAKPEPDLVFGHVQNFISPELADKLAGRYDCPPGPLPGFSLAAMLLRRRTFQRVGAFNTEYRIGEFVDWYARAKELELTSVVLPDIVLWRRLHDDNLSLRSADARGDFARILKASLDRRRDNVER